MESARNFMTEQVQVRTVYYTLDKLHCNIEKYNRLIPFTKQQVNIAFYSLAIRY